MPSMPGMNTNMTRVNQDGHFIFNGITPGQYTIPWDHRNASGSAVHGGIYMYRMTAGTFRSQKKMLFVP